jgi:catalase (peroxidase I)
MSTFAGAEHGVFTKRPEALTNDFFANLLDMSTDWKAASKDADVFEGRDRKTGELNWTGTRVDPIFGSNSQLRAFIRLNEETRKTGMWHLRPVFIGHPHVFLASGVPKGQR